MQLPSQPVRELVSEDPNAPRLADAITDAVLVVPDKMKNHNPFIPNETPQFKNSSFGANEGIDFYIDGARFLPDNATATKIVLRAFTSGLIRVVQPAGGTPDIEESTTFAPYFGFRYEFRLPHYDPTTVVVITLETIDRVHGDTRFLGNCFFPLFLDRRDK